MNIVILNDAAYIRGGADRVAFDSAGALAAAGHRVILFTAFGPVSPEVQSLRGVTVICLGSTWLRQEQGSLLAAFRGLWNREAAKRLRVVLAGLNPQETVVHAHLYSSALTASVLHASLRAGFLTLLSLHDYFITCPNGAYFIFPRATICNHHALSRACLSCHCDSRKFAHKIWRVARTWLQNRVAQIPRRLTAYAAVSETCATLARRDLPPQARIEVVPNVVAIEQQPPVNVAQNRAFVFTGRLEAYKGPQLLAEAAARLGVPVVFCGTGPLEAELRRINPNAVFTGWLEPADIVKKLGQARAFVFPSVYRETFGLSAAEALARGIPVIASRGTAAEEFVHHEKNGLLFAHNSVEDLVVQMAALADDHVTGRLGTEAYRSYWEKPLTLAAHTSRIESFYNLLLSTKLNGSAAAANLPQRGIPA
ncbi:MAG: glycosyltransferase family 4 protein [Verrucomicrobia bacterium]|nr:glycosyltransferase family 4 protein [Verrucomicrobiota bacterium]